MSLKKFVLALLIANVGYFTYNQTWFQSLLGDDASQREPERIAKQINAEAVLVTPLPALANIATPPITTTSTAEACTVLHEQWVIYMGPYATTAANNKKRAELKQLGVVSSEISKPTLKLGLSLGQFESENAARAALKKFNDKGVKTATVMLWATMDAPCEKP